eukprot:scaffold42794_cov63-Phaeocystis_antarctica.AAC.4
MGCPLSVSLPELLAKRLAETELLVVRQLCGSGRGASGKSRKLPLATTPRVVLIGRELAVDRLVIVRPDCVRLELHLAPKDRQRTVEGSAEAATLRAGALARANRLVRFTSPYAPARRVAVEERFPAELAVGTAGRHLEIRAGIHFLEATHLQTRLPGSLLRRGEALGCCCSALTSWALVGTEAPAYRIVGNQRRWSMRNGASRAVHSAAHEERHPKKKSCQIRTVRESFPSQTTSSLSRAASGVSYYSPSIIYTTHQPIGPTVLQSRLAEARFHGSRLQRSGRLNS